MTLYPTTQTILLILGLLAVLIVLAVLLTSRMPRGRGRTALLHASVEGEADPLPERWRELREEVERSDRVLNQSSFAKICQLFLAEYTGGRASPETLTSEYTREEFLLVVDEQGRANLPDQVMLDRSGQIFEAHPEFQRWLRLSVIEEGQQAGEQVLLAARWLCHLIGLRHGTVEIFIDPPHLPGHTLVQVRGMEKFEAPGAFDIPCAGHISGTDSPDVSLAKELGEELNLTLDDLEALRLVGRYNSYTGGDEKNRPALKINNEHRVLYRAQIKARAVAHIRFTDGEVAGLSVFAVSELRALVQKYPERIASGLGDAMGFYD